MKLKYAILCITACTLLLLSCDFNVNDRPGPQMSYSIDEAKSHGTFICSYSIKGDRINGILIKSIFAERKFWREQGLFEKKQINCCKSQLVIVSNQPFSNNTIGYDFDWKVKGFERPGTFLIYKDLKGVSAPDSIAITVVKVKDSTRTIQSLTLYKIRNK